VTGAAGAAFAARLAPVGAAAALVGAKIASVETTPATDGSASTAAETKVVPVGKFAALKPGGRAAVFADAEAAPVEEPSAHKVNGALAASASCKTAPGDGSAARTPDGAVAAFADTAAVPVEGIAALDNVVEETAAFATGGVAAALAESAVLCHAEHAERSILIWLPVLLIVTHAESDSCALYLMDCSAWPSFRELLGCSIPCLQEHQVVIVFEPAIPGHSPDQFCLRWLRPILTGEFARSLVLFQKGLLGLPVRLSVVSAVLFNGFRLQFVPAGLDHCVQHNLPLWA